MERERYVDERMKFVGRVLEGENFLGRGSDSNFRI